MDALRALPLDHAAQRLQGMKRPELQKLAKEAGTKANVKNVDIVASLVQALQLDACQVNARPSSAANGIAAVQLTVEAALQPSAVATGLSAVPRTAQEPTPSPAKASPAVAAEAPVAQAAPMTDCPTVAVPLVAAPTASPAAPAAAAAPTTSPHAPATRQELDADLVAEARAMAQQVRTASKRPPRTPACTPACAPGRRGNLAASALGNRLRALEAAEDAAAAAGTDSAACNVSSSRGPRAALFGNENSPAPGGANSGPFCRDSIGSTASGVSSSCASRASGARDSAGGGADAALAAAMASAAPAAGCDLSPGLLTLHGGTGAGAALFSAPAALTPFAGAKARGEENGTAGWQGATETQLREMERAWDEFKAGSPGWRAPSPAAVAAKGAALAAAGFTTVSTPLAAAPPQQQRALVAATPPVWPPRSVMKRCAPAGDENSSVNTPQAARPASKLQPPSSVSRLQPPTPGSCRAAAPGAGAGMRASAIPRPSPGNIKGPGRTNGSRKVAAGALLGGQHAKRAAFDTAGLAAAGHAPRMFGRARQNE